MIKSRFYWVKINSNGEVSEGNIIFLRRVFGRIFLGERFKKIGLWYDT